MSESGSGERAEGSRGDSLRLFCALDLPEPILEAIERWQRAERNERLRPVAPRALHLTLAFLGQRPEGQVEAIAAELAALAPRPLPARLLAEPIPLPARRPRLLALGVESEEVVELQRELAERLSAAGLYQVPSRPFLPHLTVFRLRGGGRGSGPRRDGRAGPIPRAGPFPGGDGQAFGFVRTALYRSDLRPEGATYSRLAANELPQPGGRQKR